MWTAELPKLRPRQSQDHRGHFPPGTSKWNKVEHRLFSHITMDWRGLRLGDYEMVVKLIGTTKATTGLRV